MTTELTRAAAQMNDAQIEALPTSSARTLKHRRTFCYEVYERADGLWDIDAQMQDHKSYPFTLASTVREAGDPLHSMVLRITVDDTLTIVAVHAQTLAAPYLNHCAQINPDYQKMLGMNVARGFRAAMKVAFAGVAGCTHLTEMANSLPTVAIQGVAVELNVRRRKSMGDAAAGQPFQINQCHALADTAPAVALYYPRWYRGDAPIK